MLKNKVKLFGIMIVLMLAITTVMHVNIVNAGVTDSDAGEGQIIRKTTTNYYTTVKIEGTLNNEKTGKTENFTGASSEYALNVDTDEIASEINRLKEEFSTWANGKGATKIQFVDEGIENYYYDVHDEITQEGIENIGSDVILVGDIDDIDNAYLTQGTITINTILDKHQTYTITATATIEDTDIKNVNITLQEPKAGDIISVTNGIQSSEPIAKTSDNITIDSTAWIKGTYEEAGENFEDLFEGKFELNKPYYAEIFISTKEGYTFNSNLNILINGKKPAEVFTIYNGTDTHFIAKVYPSPKEYEVLEGAKQILDISKLEALAFRVNIEYEVFQEFGKIYVDNKLVDSSNYTTKAGSTIITFTQEYSQALSNGEHEIRIEVNDGRASTNFTVINSKENPNTGDNAPIFFTIFIVAASGLVVVAKKKILN